MVLIFPQKKKAILPAAEMLFSSSFVL